MISSHTLRHRLLTVGLATATLAGLAVAAPTSADAATTTLNVIGTSDVSDSFLVQSVIKPGFERLHPDLTLNYTGKGSLQAITMAKQGGFSALIVHAASLENQFVADGYSAEPAGRAIFYGDFILAGQSSDPAGVQTAGAPSHDIVAAFEKIAAAGVTGKATFVSRNTGSGTDVAEHQIWALAKQGGSTIPMCVDSAAVGGGEQPIADASMDGTACPTPVTPPSWYAVTSTTQGANVQAADACPSSTYPNGGCYVFTDRGTFQYLQSQSLIKNSVTVVRNNDASAPGGTTILTNSFHAYALNPNKVTGVNSAGAAEFLDYLTLPSTQAAIGNYLNDRTNGAPFLPDAAPTITASAPAASVTAGQNITITGSVTNNVPGTPALAGKPVSLRVTPNVLPGSTYTGATTTTDSSGNYTLTYAPVGAATYTVTTGSITQTERADLMPNFLDILQPASSGASGSVTVQSAVRFLTVTAGTGVVSGKVELKPTDGYQVGSLELYAAPYASPTPTLKYVASQNIGRGVTNAPFQFYLPRGRYDMQLRYVNNGVILPSSTPVHIAVVG